MNITPPSEDRIDMEKEPNRKSLHTLKILDEVATGRPFTQRDLSRKLGIALGMTNNYMKRLAQQGYIQIVQTERKRLHYLLTPKGITEKGTLTYRYIKRSYQIFLEARQKMGQFFDTLQKEGVQSVVLYKATAIAEIAVLVLLDIPLELLAIVDDEMVGKRFLGHRIEPLKALSDLKFDRILITTEDPVEKVATHLSHYGVVKEKICSLQ